MLFKNNLIVVANGSASETRLKPTVRQSAKETVRSCFHFQDGEDDLKKGTQLLEIYALEIQMYTAQKNNKKLKALYDQSLHIKSAIPHPLILGEEYILPH